MSSLLERSLDEIIGSKKSKGQQGKNRGGVSKPRARHDNRHRRAHDVIREDPEIKKLSQGKPYVKITNLHYDLSEKDIEELFGKVGEVLFTRIDFDSNGRSLGVGYVGFVDSRNCTVAIDKFDGRKAAGKIISVTNGKPLAERISLAPKRGDKRTSKPKKERARKPTLEELDAELDSYKQGNAANANNDETDEKIEADEPMAQAAFPAVE